MKFDEELRRKRKGHSKKIVCRRDSLLIHSVKFDGEEYHASFASGEHFRPVILTSIQVGESVFDQVDFVEMVDAWCSTHVNGVLNV